MLSHILPCSDSGFRTPRGRPTEPNRFPTARNQLTPSGGVCPFMSTPQVLPIGPRGCQTAPRRPSRWCRRRSTNHDKCLAFTWAGKAFTSHWQLVTLPGGHLIWLAGPPRGGGARQGDCALPLHTCHHSIAPAPDRVEHNGPAHYPSHLFCSAWCWVPAPVQSVGKWPCTPSRARGPLGVVSGGESCPLGPLLLCLAAHG